MKFFIQVNEDGYITDAITYQYSNYIECELETPIPNQFIAGWYKYIGNNQYQLDEVKKQELENI